MERLEMIRPDDWHLHLRDGEALKAVVVHTARQFTRAVVMPNLKPPITTVALPLLIHGESTDPDTDIFDRETLFIENTLKQIVKKFPKLRIVFEHITTKNAVDFVLSAPQNVAATITPQHLLLNRNAIFKGGIRPHHYCLPILKREEDRQALVAAATSGNPKFFLGTDSAPHERGAKESPCGCAGIYSAHAAIELYAEAFEDAGAIEKLEGFASLHGPDFYKLPRNTEKVVLERRTQEIPASFPFPSGTVIPMRAGETIRWTLIAD